MVPPRPTKNTSLPAPPTESKSCIAGACSATKPLPVQCSTLELCPTTQRSLGFAPQMDRRSLTAGKLPLFQAAPLQRSTTGEVGLERPTAHTSSLAPAHSPSMRAVVVGFMTVQPVASRCTKVPPSPAAHTSLTEVPYTA